MLGINHSISKKIGCGYALALGTAVLGTSGGLLGGYYGAQSAREQARYTLHKKQLLHEFNHHFLSIQMHPQRLLAIAGKSNIWVHYETNQFNTELRQLLLQLDEIEQLFQTYSTVNPQRLSFINGYRLNLQQYEHFIQELWHDLDQVNNKQVALQTIALALSSDDAQQISTTFEQLSEDLTRLQQGVDRQYSYSLVYRKRAEKLSLVIIASSMVVSIGLAIILAIITSRAIAQPIEQLTLISHRVTQDNNFQLRASIQTQDEVFMLAESLNQLVSWAGQYTRELEEARQTLEDRVIERTQALQQSETSLRQKAEDLQQTLAELQQTQLQLVQSEKMSSLGQMVAGITHEINNPISFIYGNIRYATIYVNNFVKLLDLYQHHYPEPNEAIQDTMEEIDLPFLREDFPKLIQSMQEGTLRIREIVKSLRTFSRLDEAIIKQVDIHDGIESTLTILNNRLRPTVNFSGIEVNRNYGKLPAIECHAGQINQVFMNILSNAIDALETSPVGTIPKIAIATHILDPDWVAIEISDNGPGMTEFTRSRLFDPFYTTKAIGSGTGLGLSISYQIITETHKGCLICESIAGQGAKFIIQLPVSLHNIEISHLTYKT